MPRCSTAARCASSKRSATGRPFIERQLAVRLDRLEGEVDRLDGLLTNDPMAVATAIGYMELRECLLDWRETRARLAVRYNAFRRRASMVETAH